MHHVFLNLTSLGRVPNLARMLQAPFTLHSGIMQRIEQAENAARAIEQGDADEGTPRPRIVAKMNSLTEQSIIQALYRASQAGVQIDLIVRGMCCLRPGIPSVSQNIRVRSIVGRFLEHTRVYSFEINGQQELIASSADWMERNLFRRVEVGFPITDDALRETVNQELALYMADNTQAWALNADGSYTRLQPGADEDPVTAQEELLATTIPPQSVVAAGA